MIDALIQGIPCFGYEFLDYQKVSLQIPSLVPFFLENKGGGYLEGGGLSGVIPSDRVEFSQNMVKKYNLSDSFINFYHENALKADVSNAGIIYMTDLLWDTKILQKVSHRICQIYFPSNSIGFTCLEKNFCSGQQQVFVNTTTFK